MHSRMGKIPLFILWLLSCAVITGFILLLDFEVILCPICMQFIEASRSLCRYIVVKLQTTTGFMLTSLGEKLITEKYAVNHKSVFS